jgi:hypothetical protein
LRDVATLADARSWDPAELLLIDLTTASGDAPVVA